MADGTTGKHYLHGEFEALMSQPETHEFLDLGAVDGFWYWDLENPENEWMSDGFWHTLGFDPTTKKPLASEWQDLIYPEDGARALRNFERHCADPNHPYDQIVRYKTADGGTVTVRCRGKAVRRDGKPIRLLGTHTVIGDTRQDSIEEALHTLFDTVPSAVIGWDDKNNIVKWSPATTDLYGYPTPSGPVFPPDVLKSDFGMPWEDVFAVLETGAPWRGSVRHQTASGETIITNSIYQRVAISENTHCIFQIDRDETARVLAEQAQSLANRELHHRVKNLFSVVEGLIRLTARTTENREDMVEELSARVAALASAHILSMDRGETRPIQFHDMVDTLLGPMALEDQQVSRNGPDFTVDLQSVNPLGLLVHELAMNAAKHGAWSDPEGICAITWNLNEDFEFSWQESVPKGISKPDQTGFGMKLIHKSATQMGGNVEIDWKPTGIHFQLTLPGTKLKRTEKQR